MHKLCSKSLRKLAKLMARHAKWANSIARKANSNADDIEYWQASASNYNIPASECEAIDRGLI